MLPNVFHTRDLGAEINKMFRRKTGNPDLVAALSCRSGVEMNAPKTGHRESVGSFLTPESIIAAARRADPNFRYAIIAAGLLAIVAIVVKFGVSYATLMFGAIALIGLMVLIVVFAQIPTLRRTALDRAAQLLVWIILMAVVAFVVLLTTSTFFNWPLPFKDNIVQELSPAAERLNDKPGSPTEAGNSSGLPQTANTTDAGVEEVAKPIDAYKQVGWQIDFINSWGQPPTRETLRVVNKQLVGRSQDGRVVGTPVDPEELPKPQTIAGLGPEVGPMVSSFYASYGQYRAALTRLNAEPVDFLAEFTSTTVAGNEVMKRGRKALCALGTQPPVLFPQGRSSNRSLLTATLIRTSRRSTTESARGRQA